MDLFPSDKKIQPAKLKSPDFFECMVAVWGIMGIGVIWLHLTKKAARACMVLASDLINKSVNEDETTEDDETFVEEVHEDETPENVVRMERTVEVKSVYEKIEEEEEDEEESHYNLPIKSRQ